MSDTARDRLASVVVKQLHRGEYAIVDAILDELLEPGEGALLAAHDPLGRISLIEMREILAKYFTAIREGK